MGESRPALFRGRQFRDEIIVLCVRWYFRCPLSYRNIEEIMTGRGSTIDHSTIARWALHYGPLLEKRIRTELRRPNRSCRVNETYIRVAGKWTDLYRAIDSAGNTIDFLLSPKRDRIAAKGFLQLALWRVGQIRPRVINVDGHPAYPGVVDELKRAGQLSRSCRCRVSAYVNKRIEQDHRFVKKRVVAGQWFRSVDGALNKIAGYEAMNMIRKVKSAGHQKPTLWGRCASSSGCSGSLVEVNRFEHTPARVCGLPHFGATAFWAACWRFTGALRNACSPA